MKQKGTKMNNYQITEQEEKDRMNKERVESRPAVDLFQSKTILQKVKEGERKAKQRGVEIKRHLVKEKVSR